jgi:hypothetical protein
MKNVIAFVLVLFFAKTTFAQNQNYKAENLGLISELIFIKLASENLSVRVLTDNQIKETDKIRFVNLYNDTKIITDQVILQLIANCRQTNSLKYFKELDNLLLTKDINQIDETQLSNLKLKKYVKNLKNINIVSTKLINFKTSDKLTENVSQNASISGFIKTNITIPELTGVLSFVTATIKDIRENKEKKVEKIMSMLNDVRLSRLEDLIKDKTGGTNQK